MENEIEIGLYHVSNKESIYSVDKKAAMKSPVLSDLCKPMIANVKSIQRCIINGDERSMIIIIKYLNFYKDSDEANPPEHPLLENISINELFEFEGYIFNELLNELLVDDEDTQVDKINKLYSIADELQLEIFKKKIAAITCYLMQSHTTHVGFTDSP